MFHDEVLQPPRPWRWWSASGGAAPDPPDGDGEDDDQSDPGGDSDVTPDPARSPEERAVTG